MAFDHEKLDVYQMSIEFVARANQLIEKLPRGRGYLADQLQRAALSVVLNIAEGAGKFSAADKAAFYTRARASATESAAVLDVCGKLGLIPAPSIEDNKALLERIVQMLTKLIKTPRGAQ
ncbi:MAG TPA: four helix bundle protein [Thermoanaerobaculia bacterium]|nr:four helix bundle protein [Thermoanaerobaculia bacterium]